MTEHVIRCTVTRYSVEFSRDMNEQRKGSLVETTAEETTSAELRRPLPPYKMVDGARVYLRPPEEEPLYLHLGNSAASASWRNLLAIAHEGRGWSAQAGCRPVYADGRFSGRNYPEIYVSAEAILELEEALANKGTTNHGLAGGRLDASKHVEAAIPRLLFPSEVESYRDTILPAPDPAPDEVPEHWRAS